MLNDMLCLSLLVALWSLCLHSFRTSSVSHHIHSPKVVSIIAWLLQYIFVNVKIFTEPLMCVLICTCTLTLYKVCVQKRH